MVSYPKKENLGFCSAFFLFLIEIFFVPSCPCVWHSLTWPPLWAQGCHLLGGWRIHWSAHRRGRRRSPRWPKPGFPLSWACPPPMSKGLDSRQTRNNAPVIRFETKIQQRHVFAARKQIAFSFLSRFFSPKQNILLWNMSNLQYLLSLYLITGKGLLDFCWFLHFLLKFLRGFWGNLISRKRRRKKNCICIPQALLMEETCCLFKSIFWWEKANGHVFRGSDSYSWPCLLLSCLYSSERLVWSSLPKKMGLLRSFQPEKVPHCQARREANDHWRSKCGSLHSQSHFTASQPAGQPWLGRRENGGLEGWGPVYKLPFLVAYIPWEGSARSHGVLPPRAPLWAS